MVYTVLARSEQPTSVAQAHPQVGGPVGACTLHVLHRPQHFPKVFNDQVVNVGLLCGEAFKGPERRKLPIAFGNDCVGAWLRRSRASQF